jgi:tripartite-type tricarboxylate transporter receptor subunit TctC
MYIPNDPQRVLADDRSRIACVIKKLICFVMAVGWIFAGSVCSYAQSVDDFYRGKQLRLIVGSAPGDDYDVWARLIVRYMTPFIPGIPGVVVENMLGAGSLVATNYLYAKAPQDGTVMGMVSRNIPNYAVMKQPNAYFDPLKFNWIGSPELTHRGCFARTDSGIRTPQDLLEHELLVGGTGAGTALTETPLLLKNLLGLKFKLIDGYKGATEVILAMERKELDSLCQSTTAFMQVAKRLLDNGTFRALFTTEREPVPELGVPTIYSIAKTDEQRKILDFYASSLEMGRPIMAPPGVPSARVDALRRAFDAAMKSPAFLDEARQRKMDPSPRTGEQLEMVVRSVAELPADLIAKASQMTRR